jgi:DNA-directed RNA polymerase subunit beta'
VRSKFNGKLQYEGIKSIEIRDDEGSKIIVIGRSGVVNVLDQDNRMLTKYDVPYGAILLLRDKAEVAKGEIIYEWDPYNAVIISEHGGTVRYQDLKDNVTYREEPDEQTGHIQKVVIDTRDRTLSPSLVIVGSKGEKVPTYIIPTRSHLVVDDGVQIASGTILVKIPRDIGKTRDITGGLPRVTELFEARSPADPPLSPRLKGRSVSAGRSAVRARFSLPAMTARTFAGTR